ncbi:expressed unknown protein [Seminavis robusta]|uniref:Arf-GAP domain-containing protein n=1 Tax=Seminavis robusta TaxID=568900 RepID=A0A9N8DGS9_9STRA|nr:expressed unknown protein [Seminavis robusta]|eukprot:Sro144_g067020.1 n/a (841) ;mRNA; f:60519-63041
MPSTGVLVAPTRHDVMGLRLEEVLSNKGNKTCADCPTKKPLWASYLRSRKQGDGDGDLDDSSVRSTSSRRTTTSASSSGNNEMKGVDIEGTLAVLVCNDCAQHHHFELGKKRCMIKYLKYSHELTPVDLDILENSGNALVNKYYEAFLTKEAFDKEAIEKDLPTETERRGKFIKNKYKKTKYRDHAALAKLIPKLQRKRQIREMILENAAAPHLTTQQSFDSQDNDNKDSPEATIFRRTQTMNDAENIKAVGEKEKAALEGAQAVVEDGDTSILTVLRRCKTDAQNAAKKVQLSATERRQRALAARRAVRRRSSFSDPSDLLQQLKDDNDNNNNNSTVSSAKAKAPRKARRRRSSFGDSPTSPFLGDFGNTNNALSFLSRSVSTGAANQPKDKTTTEATSRRCISFGEQQDPKPQKPQSPPPKKSLDLANLRKRMENVKTLLDQSTEEVNAKLGIHNNNNSGDNGNDGDECNDDAPTNRRRSSLSDLKSFDLDLSSSQTLPRPPKGIGRSRSTGKANLNKSLDLSETLVQPPKGIGRSRSTGAKASTLHKSCSGLDDITAASSSLLPVNPSRSKSPKLARITRSRSNSEDNPIMRSKSRDRSNDSTRIRSTRDRSNDSTRMRSDRSKSPKQRDNELRRDRSKSTKGDERTRSKSPNTRSRSKSPNGDERSRSKSPMGTPSAAAKSLLDDSDTSVDAKHLKFPAKLSSSSRGRSSGEERNKKDLSKSTSALWSSRSKSPKKQDLSASSSALLQMPNNPSRSRGKEEKLRASSSRSKSPATKDASLRGSASRSRSPKKANRRRSSLSDLNLLQSSKTKDGPSEKQMLRMHMSSVLDVGKADF